jgi:hypothetical protein
LITTGALYHMVYMTYEDRHTHIRDQLADTFFFCESPIG